MSDDLLKYAGALIAAGRWPEAAEQLGRLTAEQPGHARGWFLLGAVYGQMRRIGDSIRCSERAIALAPSDPAARYNAAQGYLHQRRFQEAIPHLEAIVSNHPGHFDALNNLGIACQGVGDRTRARAYLEKALQLRPDAEATRFVLASLGGGEQPASAPRAFVTDLFDKYADRFDEHLVKDLAYRTPGLLVPLALGQLAAGRVALDIMDIGCGTGLCGPLLKPRARRLLGVDLSSSMVARARARGVYDDLMVGDIEEVLAQYRAAFDLITGADVFPYIGDLDEVLRACHRSLRTDGLLAISTEASPCQAGYELRATTRYAHSAAYVRDTAAAAGFVEAAFQESVLRKDRGAPVNGFLFAFRASHSTA